MKLESEEIKKLILGSMMVLGIILLSYIFLLGPLMDKHAATRAAIKALEPKLKASKDQIERTRKLETTAPAATLVYKQLTSLISSNSPVAWFPPRMTDLFSKAGIELVNVRPNGNPTANDAFKGFQIQSWSIEVPSCYFGRLIVALPAIENEEILLQIRTLNIDALKDDVEKQRVSMTAINLVRE